MFGIAVIVNSSLPNVRKQIVNNMLSRIYYRDLDERGIYHSKRTTIGNLYKTQIYQLVEYLGIPKALIERIPTTDTYTAEQTQEEFFYQLPFELMDRYWYGFENGYPAEKVAEVMGETKERVDALYNNFERIKQTTEYLRMSPVRDYYKS